ncbi:zinc-binding alcohol dehydrogenase [Variovorax dokdonensis]|uniref:Zinc-binding alcohol dehydrogenase n=1 Tax=Variovorax dokdonensis TaxID=344883 RepID=A0ABT7N5R8_9BURK|nr:zinc-binding alcohol dehydrogenase [Variovorax dokdonensis]MDM0043266.1 zinc-binding alcohol dehydrogenase [Variovorax dokdonensis]
MPAYSSPADRAQARACWIAAPGRAEIRTEPVATPAEGEVLVRTRHSAVSRGTEMLVFQGRVPASEHERMRAPFQQGTFPGPVKYGYVNVGCVEQGPAHLLGRDVFCLYPHQTRYVVPATAVHPLPEGLPAARAVLAANMQTAINALWDAAPRVGDRIAVVGGGVVGLLTGWLAARMPGCAVQLIDTQADRAAVAARLGMGFALPEAADPDADLVVHASGHPEGLATALRLAAFEATVLEMSWYGDRPVTLPLGEAFHARRLRIRSSQVGHIAASQRSRWTHDRRAALALSLLVDAPELDALITDSAPFENLPQVLARLSGDAPGTLCQRIDYSYDQDPF